MKKLPIQRLLAECINLVMALLFVIPLGVLAEQLCGYPLYRCCLIPMLAGIGFVLGRISMTRSATLASVLCGIGLVIGAVLAVILTPHALVVKLLITLLTAFFSVFFFFSARKAGYSIYAPMAITGILLHVAVLIVCTGMQWPQRVAQLLSWVSIVYFLLTLFSFSSKGLRKSLHKGNSERKVNYPAGMQMGNFFLVTGFIIIAAFVSNIYPIFRLFSKGFSYVIAAIISFFAYFTSLFDKKTTVGTDPVDTVESIAEDSILNAEPKGEASWVTSMVEIIAFVVVLLVLLYVVYKLICKLRASGLRLPGFLQNFRDRFAPVVMEDYVDETENLFNVGEMLGDTRDRMKKALKRFRERPQRMEDLPDSRMKVRFAFQQLLKRTLPQDPGAMAKTPNEILETDTAQQQDMAQFISYYNAARYSHEDVPEAAVDCAKKILKQK